MSTVLTGYQPRRWRRVCDVCGSWKTFPDQFVDTSDNVYMCDEHWRETKTQDLDRVNARIVPRAHQPVPNAKPLSPIDSWDTEEGQVLTQALVAPLPPVLGVTSSTDVQEPGMGPVQQAAWAALYLYELIVEDKRSVQWIADARGRLEVLGDYLLANQAVGPLGMATGPNSDVGWGAYRRVGVADYFVEDSGAAGLALLRAYQLIGTNHYLEGADACAWFVRGAQCGDIISFAPSSTDLAGLNVKHFGCWSHRIRAEEFDNTYRPSDLICLEFLEAYRAEVGDILIGSVTTSAPFTASRQALLSVSIDEARAFWADGAFDLTFNAQIVGLSAVTPKEFYNTGPVDKGLFFVGGLASWEYRSGRATDPQAIDITAYGYAIALRAFYKIDGLSAFVTSLWDWLQSFGSNPDFEFDHTPRLIGVVGVPDVTDEALRELFLGNLGDYSPALAPSTVLQVRVFDTHEDLFQNGSDIYDWSAAGLMAGIQAARKNFDFQEARIAVNAVQPSDKGLRPATYHLLALDGLSGLSFQPIDTTDSSLFGNPDVARSSQVGFVYREQPQRFLLQGPS